MTQCYYNDGVKDNEGNSLRCEKEAYPGSYWCTKDHQIKYQNATYGGSGENKPKKSIEEIQKRILEMKKKAR